MFRTIRALPCVAQGLSVAARIAVIPSSFALLACLGLVGCIVYPAPSQPAASPPPQAAQNPPPDTNPPPDITKCATLRPQIQQIGANNVLTYEGSNAAQRKRETRIVIDARDLIHDCYLLGVYLQGTVPPVEGVDFEVGSNRPRPLAGSDTFDITFTSTYLDRLHSGDQLIVYMVLSDLPETRVLPEASGQTAPRFRQFYEREFTFYETQYYRDKVLANQIPVHQIEAYPLPELEAEALFGEAVSANFFAVRLTINNGDDYDKLINSGRIVARGRALVQPKNGAETTGTARQSTTPSDKDSWFTVSVAVTPQSDKQMFTALDDTQPFTPRNWLFRSLDFVGTLATVIVGATSAPGVAMQAAGLFTGTFTPATRQLIPDKYDAYKRNIVAYAMPELIKVPRRDSVGNRYLFFSKNKMQGLIMNQNLFNFETSQKVDFIPNLLTPMPPLLQNENLPKPPDVALVSLQFDHLEIPFERVVGNAEASVRDRVETLRNALPSKQMELDKLATDWTTVPTSAFLLTGLTHDDLDKVNSPLKSLLDAANASKAAATAAHDDVKTKALGDIATALSFFQLLRNDLEPDKIKQDLILSKVFGAGPIRQMTSDAANLSTQIIAGRDPDLMQNQVKTVEDAVTALDQAFRYYTMAASVLKKGSVFVIPGRSDVASAANIGSLDADTLTRYAASLQAIQTTLKANAAGLLAMSAVALNAAPAVK